MDKVTLLGKRLPSIWSQLLKRDIWLALVVTVAVIVTGLFFGWYSDKVIPLNSDSSARYLQEPNNPLSFMANWDGTDYLHIASQGYGDAANTNFFPLYPLLIHVLEYLTRSMLTAALLISWLSFLGAAYFFIKVVRHLFEVDGHEAMRALIFFVLFPTAIFMLGAYTEALFAFFALGALFCALKNKPWQSAYFLAFSTATHVTGLFVVMLVAMILREQKASLKVISSTVAIGCMGLLGYMAYLWEAFGQPFGFIVAQKSHGWLTGGDVSAIKGANVLNLLFMALLLWTVCYWWSRRRSFALYSLLYLLVPFFGQEFGGFNRYALMAFPIPLMLYMVARKRPTLYAVALSLTAIGWTFYLLHYAAGYIGG